MSVCVQIPHKALQYDKESEDASGESLWVITHNFYVFVFHALGMKTKARVKSSKA